MSPTPAPRKPLAWRLRENPRSVTFTVHGIAAPKGSMKAFIIGGKPRLTNMLASTKTWEQRVASVAEDHALPATLQGPVEVRLAFWLPRPKSAPKKRRTWPIGRKLDADKLARTVLDALTGPILGDDGQVVRLVVDKDYGDPPRVEIEVREI